MLISAAPGALQQVIARVLPGGGLPEVLQGLPGRSGHVLGHLDGHSDQQVPVGPVAAAHTLAAHPEGAAVGGARRDPDADRGPAVRRHLDLRAQRGLRECHRHGDREVVPGPAEHRMRRDVHAHIQVPGRPATLPGRTLALQLDLLAVSHAGRDARLDSPGAHRPPAAGAHRARVVDHQPAAAALMARLGERETAQVLALLAGPFTVRADPRDSAGLGAGALAGRAGTLAGQPEADRDAVQRVAERQRGLRLHVGTPPRPVLRGTRPATAAAEHAAEDVSEPAARVAAGRAAGAEQVAEVEVESPAARAAGCALASAPEPAAEQGACVVVLLAPLAVGQRVVGLGDLLEPLLRLGVTLVGVGVVLAGELAVRLLDLVRAGGLGDAQDLVIVLLEEVLRAHLLPLPGGQLFPAG